MTRTRLSTASRLLGLPSTARSLFTSLGLAATAILAPTATAQDCATTPPATCDDGMLVDTTESDCYGCPFGTEDGTWDSDPKLPPATADPLEVPKFNPLASPCANLVQVDVILRANAQATVDIENTDDKPNSFLATIRVNVSVQPINVTGIPDFTLSPEDVRPLNLAAFDGALDFGMGGASGTTYTTGIEGDTRCFRFTNPADLAQFIDSTPANLTDNLIRFNHESNDEFTQTGGAQVASVADTIANVQVDIIYTTCECVVTAVDDERRICVGESTSIPVLANDTSTCGAIAPGSIMLNPSPGFSLVGGNVVFNSVGRPAGVYQTTYSITDAGGQPCPSNSATVRVEVCETVALDDSRNMCGGNVITWDVLANDSTTCGALDPTSLMFVGPVAPGLSIVGGQIRYDSNVNPAATVVNFTYRVCNNQRTSAGTPCCDTAMATINVCRTNPMDDNAFVCVGDSVLIDVLANDSANCGGIDPSSLVLVSNVPGFSVVGGQIRFDSSMNPAMSGNVSVDYQIANVGPPRCFASATVTVNVCTVTAAPLNDTLCFGETSNLTPMVNSTCGGTTTLSLVAPVPAGFSIVGNQIRYNSNLGPASGTVMVNYRASSPGPTPCTAMAQVTIEICANPVAQNDTVQVTDASLASIDIDILDNDMPGEGATFPGCGGCPGGMPCAVEITSGPTNGSVVINPDCTVTYTPSGASIVADQFCYRVTNDKGCFDDACVTINAECVPINRRECGSLLLFPEWDNRPGVVTLVTVTNKNCPPTGNPNVDNISIEYVYIDKDGCQEFNRVETLTPCDTLTVLTNDHNPGFGEGFLYVFARRWLNGPPVSFNYLIGQSVVLDGLDAFDYGVNAVAFESPLARGMETDVNDNGLRDLNDIEYRGAPDEILIPRFLGQCTPGMPPAGGGPCVESELVLVNLTGGAAFLATVDFLIYNDNEQQFSAEYTFNCWANPTLLEISNVFGQDFLATTMQDPGEIIGARGLESGWFKFNGALADSPAVSIPNPAIYGFLIEKVGVYAVADLPFELCSQTNGALYARNILGTF